MRRKVTIVGSGNVGASTVQKLAERDLADVVLVDILEGVPQGKALDLMESAPLMGFDARITGSNAYEETAGSDLIIITAGLSRKPGMSREDLLLANAKIVAGIAREAAKHSPQSIFLVVTNPVDLMTHLVARVAGFPTQRVVGMGGVLDAARFRTFIAMSLGVSVKNIQAFVMGGHGDQMVPLPRYSTVSGIPLTELLSAEEIARLVERTRDGGGEIVNLLKTGSAYYAPAAAIVEMAEAILLDRKEILPCVAYLDGEYGVKGYYVGVPVKLGKGGAEATIEIRLNSEERAAFAASVAQLKRGVEEVDALIREGKV